MFGFDKVTLPSLGAVFIGFSTQKGALSWFIRRATGSPASHSFLVYWSEQFNQHMVLEVQGRGFVQVPWDDWRGHNKLLALYEIEREDEVVVEAMKKLGTRLGDPYDSFSLIGFLLIHVVEIWDRNDLDDKEKLVCSEMVALFLRWAGIPLNAHIDRVIPLDLWKLAYDNEAFSVRYTCSSIDRKMRQVLKKGQVLCESDHS